MKKIVLFSLAILLCGTVFGQASSVTPPAPASGDFTGTGPTYATPTYTVTNTGADTAHAKITPGINNYLFQSLTFQIDITKVSGTAGGTVTLYASNETGLGNMFVSLATYSITTATTQAWSTKIPGNPYTNYWLVVAGTGTEVLTCNMTLLER